MTGSHDKQQPDSQAIEAYQAIRTAIIGWDLPPGAQVTEGQLATRTGFGRSSVRAALTRLSHERLVVAIPRRGYEVAPITFKYISDVFGVRMVLEPAAAKQVAARGDDATIARLEAINERCRYVPDPSDAPQLRLANKEFHVAIAQATGNDRLADFTSASLDDLQRILYLPQVAQQTDRVAATFEEHADIISAIRHRELKAVEEAAIVHIERNRGMIIDMLIGTAEIGAINLFHR